MPRTTKTVYPFELKLAAVKARLEEGTSTREVVEEFSIGNSSTLEEWCRRYRAGGEDALRPKRRGRPPKASKPPGEETLEERCMRLEMENAVLKKLEALAAEKRRLGRRR